MAGKVYLVGSGPGSEGLLTQRGRSVIDRADVVLYDQLPGEEILATLPKTAEKIDCGKYGGRHTLEQDEIEALMVDRAQKGKTVVRLKGGDPFMFGRGGEELETVRAAGIPVEMVPGISSALAVPASMGIPLTHRKFASQVTILTGNEDPTKKNFMYVNDTLIYSDILSTQKGFTKQVAGAGDPAYSDHTTVPLKGGYSYLLQEVNESDVQVKDIIIYDVLEEAHEVLEAVDRGDRAHLREELGDLLLQVVFHARVAEEDPDDPFSVDDVAAGIVAKLVHRHPHVFAEVEVDGPAAVEANWERLKAEEKGRRGVFEGIPATLPALARAQKMLSRLERAVGRGDATGEVGAVLDAAVAGDPVAAGLLRVVREAAAGGTDAETALRAALTRLVDAVDPVGAADPDAVDPDAVDLVAETRGAAGRSRPGEGGG
mgnify:CR=1 FL=1